MTSLRDLFSGLTDEEFAQLLEDVQQGRICIPIVLEARETEEP